MTMITNVVVVVVVHNQSINDKKKTEKKHYFNVAKINENRRFISLSSNLIMVVNGKGTKRFLIFFLVKMKKLSINVMCNMWCVCV